MPVNPYGDRKVSLRRPHGNGDLDIVRASYTRRKANVTEAQAISSSLLGQSFELFTCHRATNEMFCYQKFAVQFRVQYGQSCVAIGS